MIPKYLFSKDKIKEHRQAMESRVKKLTRQAANLNEKEKELFIHDFIAENVKYDKLKKEYSHEIIGALGNGTAVCEGIAKAVKFLCDELNIWCIIALSEANPDKGIKYRHAWNVVRIDGQYYHLDATFDNTLSRNNLIRYDYVNLSDKQISEITSWSSGRYRFAVIPIISTIKKRNYPGQRWIPCRVGQSRQ